MKASCSSPGAPEPKEPSSPPSSSRPPSTPNPSGEGDPAEAAGQPPRPPGGQPPAQGSTVSSGARTAGEKTL
eukprot:7890300-Alexandrium_andersonii.AAC.1